MSEPTPTLAERVVARARSQLGVSEPQAFDFYSDGERVSWCAAFVIWCYAWAGLDLPGNRWRNRAVWHLQRQLVAEGWGVYDDHARPGDIAIQMRQGSRVGEHGILDERSVGHIGIVSHASEAGDRLHIIEGNVRDAVREVTHWAPYVSILGFYRPPPETTT